MYLTEFHIFTIFASLILFAFFEFLIYYYKRQDKKIFLVYSLTLFIFTSIFSYSTLMLIDSSLKSVELRNINYFKNGAHIAYSGVIYNKGSAPVKTCTLNIRIINVGANKKVDGSIFSMENKSSIDLSSRPKYSYSHSFFIDGVINKGASKNFRVNIPYPKHFRDYKIINMIKCK